MPSLKEQAELEFSRCALLGRAIKANPVGKFIVVKNGKTYQLEGKEIEQEELRGQHYSVICFDEAHKIEVKDD